MNAEAIIQAHKTGEFGAKQLSQRKHFIIERENTEEQYRELQKLGNFDTMDQFIEELEAYIDYYNNKRIKSKLKGLSPVQYRIQSSRAA